uniref:Uncharacterized protein n=1 Tax=Anguilla anguilla TaxID=7936 RepID=A0A0E9TFQ6_ANGAN
MRCIHRMSQCSPSRRGFQQDVRSG